MDFPLVRTDYGGFVFAAAGRVGYAKKASELKEGEGKK